MIEKKIDDLINSNILADDFWKYRPKELDKLIERIKETASKKGISNLENYVNTCFINEKRRLETMTPPTGNTEHPPLNATGTNFDGTHIRALLKQTDLEPYYYSSIEIAIGNFIERNPQITIEQIALKIPKLIENFRKQIQNIAI